MVTYTPLEGGYTAATDSLTIFLDPGNVMPDTAVAAFPTSFFLAPGDSQRVTFSIRPQLLAPIYYSAAITVIPQTGVAQTSLVKVFLFQIMLTSITEPTPVPGEFVLHQSFPNPFNPAATIRFELPRPSDVRLSVFDIVGHEVLVLVNERKDAGFHEVKFDASGLSSGVYFYRLRAGDFGQSKKTVLLK